MNSRKLIINLGVGLFAVLFIVGVLVLYFLEIRPKQRIQRADGWPKVNCTVTEAKQSFDDNTYSATYTYDVAGTTYQSQQLTFWPGNIDSSIVVGATFWGVVNPDDPQDAVLMPKQRQPELVTWVLYGWVVISGLGFLQYLLVRLNLKRLRMSYVKQTKLYYSEM